MSDGSLPAIAPTDSSKNARTLEQMEQQKRETANQLGQAQFMQLLVQQMANQDPLSPSTDTEFIAQLAQFTSLEQISALAATSQQSQMYSLIGKYIAVQNPEVEGGIEWGKVDGVATLKGVSYLVVGEKSYVLSDVLAVQAPAETQSVEQAPSVTNSTGLLGREIAATAKDADGNVIEVKGTVVRLFTKDGMAYATISTAENGNMDVAVSSIEEIYS